MIEAHASRVQWIGTCSELAAAYAADGYARIRGVGALVTTYSVGELSALNGVAGSFAERVPLVVITGAPTTSDQRERPLLHHTLGDYNIPKQMYKQIAVASTTLDDPTTAPDEIDRVLSECLYHHLPCYISLPSDMVYKPCRNVAETPLCLRAPSSDPNALQEALDEAVQLIKKSANPIVIADVELLRYNLSEEFRTFIQASGLIYATMMMGKAIIEEEHPQFIGLYAGQSSRDYVRNTVDHADCILLLGAHMSDFNTGGFTVRWDSQKVISAQRFQVTIKHHIYPNVTLKDFIVGLTARLPKRDISRINIVPASEGCIHRRTREYIAQDDTKITHKRFFDRIAHFIPENAVVVVDTGNSMFGMIETMLPKGTTFISQMFYGSIGYAVGAALGAALAAPNRPVILFIGDGAFQVTASDFSTIIRNNCNITTFLMNNDGYTTERTIVDGTFNDLQPWKYSLLPVVFGGRQGCDVRTEGELEVALKGVKFGENTPHFIEFHLDKWDCSPVLRNVGTAMRRHNSIPF